MCEKVLLDPAPRGCGLPGRLLFCVSPATRIKGQPLSSLFKMGYVPQLQGRKNRERLRACVNAQLFHQPQRLADRFGGEYSPGCVATRYLRRGIMATRGWTYVRRIRGT
ncbi:hypothetical protein M408DRAFT_219925 [Serendipita vermifera MAFF 305830]|uniref:Uncharacterized protein n=1 Tax=Serendipita vermifera MAFF 305830 TaxID=933852 RepID=A0A0C3BM27_SERVB|nr:hypothetical protein M408DRAFT_219925 [Serendipita vermifera MAFF 305830]